MPEENDIAPGTLMTAIKRATERAVASGALRSIETDTELIEDTRVRFVVRVVSSLARKQAEGGCPSVADPLAEHEPDLFVADVSGSHYALLNKFSLLDGHLLIVTRQFEHQERLLTKADFSALARCLAEIDGLAIYNGGANAGASQPHKHLQLVPLPLEREAAPGGPAVPMEALFEAVGQGMGVLQVPKLPFRHAFGRLDARAGARIDEAGQTYHGLYRALLQAVGIEARLAEGGETQSAAYNLLATRRWMLLVPRSRESFQSVSVNAFGFAGSLFLRHRDQLAVVRAHGPMSVLREVAMTRSGKEAAGVQAQ